LVKCKNRAEFKTFLGCNAGRCVWEFMSGVSASKIGGDRRQGPPFARLHRTPVGVSWIHEIKFDKTDEHNYYRSGDSVEEVG
jgi:hypothetical protein